MGNFVTGLEISVIGFTITMVTLFGLALLLILFTKAFSDEQKGQGTGGTTVSQKVEQQAQPAVKIQVESSPAEKTLRPEIVAAAIGALQYSLEKQAPAFPMITKIRSEGTHRDVWAQASRTRLINLRQDFVSYKRGKFR
ncbi:MAG: hypothetical protein GX334_08120 [Firmicutes bacterium]|nr:hypothetical protein [Bacillota bacterium]